MDERSNSNSGETGRKTARAKLSENQGEKLRSLPVYLTTPPSKSQVFGKKTQFLKALPKLPILSVVGLTGNVENVLGHRG